MIARYIFGLPLALALPLSAQIEVRANFEGGKVGKVEVVSPTHLRCAVPGQADRDNRNRQADWYYFELAACRGRRLRSTWSISPENTTTRARPSR